MNPYIYINLHCFVLDMIQMKGSTHTEVSLNVATELLVNSANPKATLTIILFTDGDCNDSQKILEAATEVKYRYGVRIITIGVRDHINTENLKRIASLFYVCPGSGPVYSIGRTKFLGGDVDYVTNLVKTSIIF